MKKTLSGLALAVVTAIALSACTTRETRIVQPAVVAPAAPAGTAEPAAFLFSRCGFQPARLQLLKEPSPGRARF